MLNKTLANHWMRVLIFIFLFLIIGNLFVQEARAEEEVLADVTSNFYCQVIDNSTFTAYVCRDGSDPYIKFTIQYSGETFFGFGTNVQYMFVISDTGIIPITCNYDTLNKRFIGTVSLSGKQGGYITGIKVNNTLSYPKFEVGTNPPGYYYWHIFGGMMENWPNIYINPVWFNYKPIVTLTMDDNQALSDEPGNNVLTISGTVQDQNIGNTNVVKYSIDGVEAHNSITIATITADNTNIPFSYDVNIDTSIPPGTHTLRVWAEDTYTSSTQELRTFTVVKTVGSSGEPYIRAITSEGKAFNFDNTTGNYSDVTSTAMVNNFGSSKPFYLKECIHKLSGTDNTFYDYGSISAYIGNYLMRVATSEGRAFDVDIDNGSYTEVSDSFMNNNFGSGKPFYLKEDAKYINGYGPFMFYDFGSTMAYIGNDTFRVVTAEGKAFDVDKDTGSYTEVTSTFLVNNWGSGKPFYLREYSQTIGGETLTFYDFGSSMCYLGNNIIRVVTSENKVFDVNKDTGAYADVTSTVPLVCFGSEKPFFNRTYTANIGGTDYTFYDFGTSLAYMDPTLADSQGIDITCSTAEEIEAYGKITLTGTASEENNNDLTISATINSVTKNVTLTNTTNPQEWTLEWDLLLDGIPEGDFTNITITANNGQGQLKRIYYNGTISVYILPEFTGKTVIYEYDEAGRMTKRREVVSN